MKSRIAFFLIFVLFLTGCGKDNIFDIIGGINKPPTGGKTNDVLMLIVDYTSLKFEGGKIFRFSEPSETFTITNEYQSPGDFGSVKLFYSEINELLFHGGIVWMGCGEIIFPENILSRDDFRISLTDDYVFPTNGFEDVLNLNDQTHDYSQVWGAVQNIVKVREFLNSNKEQTVKMLFYTPSVGFGNPEDWKWVIFMNN